MTVHTDRCEKLSRAEVPTPPRRTRDDVVDDGLHRWRFDKRGRLTVYIQYRPDWRDADGNAVKFPWERLWTLDGDVGSGR